MPSEDNMLLVFNRLSLQPPTATFCVFLFWDIYIFMEEYFSKIRQIVADGFVFQCNLNKKNGVHIYFLSNYRCWKT